MSNTIRLYPENCIIKIADLLREGNSTSDTYTLSQMPRAVSTLTNKGGDAAAFFSLISSYVDTKYINFSSNDTYSSIKPYLMYSISSNTLTSIYYPNVEKIGNYAFYSCKYLTSIYIPNCKVIGDNTFRHCYSIAGDLDLSKVEIVDNYAFYRCSSLTSISLPLCKSVGENAFYSCININMISLDLPNCNYIGNNAFGSYSTLTSISVPVCYQFAGFNNCTNLTSVELPETLSLGKSALFGCTNLESISFSKCRYASQGAFGKCSSLSIIENSNITTLANALFGSCTNLLTVNFPKVYSFEETTTYSWTGAFNNCNKLESLIIDFSNIEYIPAYTFNLCSNLSMALTFPKLSIIGSSAFYGCNKLSVLNLLSNSICILSNTSAFDNTPMSKSTYLGYYGSIYVPSSLVDSYKSATNWVTYAARITAFVEE